MNTIRCRQLAVALALACATPFHALAEPTPVFGFKVSAGGRYDDVRMCVATSPGTKGGPAGDISFLAEWAVGSNRLLSLDIPVFRPILFATAFEMLQFEPDLTLKFRYGIGERTGFLVGPSLGVSLHYGPDYQSPHGANHDPSFFALGPRLGAYAGFDFARPNQAFNFQLGLHPYVTPLFGVSDPADHKGVAVGASLDALFRFTAMSRKP